MDIKVWDDKYVIRSDTYCYILREIKKKQPKPDEDTIHEVVENGDGTYEVTIAYPSNIANCFRYIVEAEGRNNRCTTLDGYIKHLEKINHKLEENLLLFQRLVGADENLEAALNRIRKKEQIHERFLQP